MTTLDAVVIRVEKVQVRLVEDRTIAAGGEVNASTEEVIQESDGIVDVERAVRVEISRFAEFARPPECR